MELFLQQVINGITIGAFYALIALGYSMVYGILRLINFAHGDLFMFGSYLGLTLFGSLLLTGRIPNFIPALLIIFLMVMGLVALVGVVMERVAYRPLRHAGRLAPIVSALGVAIFIENAVMLTYGTEYQVYPERILPPLAWNIGGARLTLLQVVTLVISFLLMLSLYLFINNTRLGTAIRAVSLDHDTSRLMGIDVNRIVAIVFFIGPALGAAAGIMVGLHYRQINFTLGWRYGLKAFTAAIMGGIGNIPGAMVGGMLLGLFETLGAGYVSAAWKDAFALIILIFILIVRPTGLLGERVAEKL